MWIDVVYGLLPVGQVYFIMLICITGIKKRTSDIGTYDPLHLGIFFLWIEEKR
jgi:hypothetical protein